MSRKKIYADLFDVVLTQRIKTKNMFYRSLFVVPDTGISIIEASDSAKKSLLIKMFLFSDAGLIHAVIAAKKRGVKVKVMLNPARRNGEEENEDAMLSEGSTAASLLPCPSELRPVH